MKYLVLFAFIMNSCFACDWSTIKQVGNEFVYSMECHKDVGRLVMLNTKNEDEIKALRTSIEMKDLAIQDSDSRILLWKNESYKQYDFLQKQEQNHKLKNSMYFVTGFLAVVLGAWAAGQVKK